MKRPSARTALLALSVGLSTSACGVEETGIPPPIDALYYPVGLAAHPDGRYLYVANAGFDRRYNAGTVTVMDTWTRRLLPESTVSTGLFAGELAVARFGRVRLVRGDVKVDATADREIVRFEVRNVGSLAAEEAIVRLRFPDGLEDTQLAIAPGAEALEATVGLAGDDAHWRVVRLEPGAALTLEASWACAADDCRLAGDDDASGVHLSFRTQWAGQSETDLERGDARVPEVPRVQALLVTREDTTLTVLEVDATRGEAFGHLDCGQVENGRCDAQHRIVRYEGLTDRPTVGGDPYGLALDATGLFLSHVDRGELSRWDFVGFDADAPSVLRPRGICRLSLAGGASSVARHPALGWAYVSDRFGQAVSTVELLDPLDRGELGRVSPERCRMEERGAVVVDRNPARGRSRGLAFAADGTRLYVASNTDASLRVYETSVGPRGRPPHNLLGAIPLGGGPNVVRVAGLRAGERRAPGGPDTGDVGRAVDARGEGLVYVTAFEDNRVLVVDPALLAVVAKIETGGGPHDIVFLPDADGRLFAWVTNFRDHTLSVIDIDPESDRRFTVVATVR